MAIAKKRVIKSLENLPEDLRELMREQYPGGYESSIIRITNAKKEPIFVFPMETKEAIFLVKVPATKNSEGEYDVESSKKQEFDAEEDDMQDPQDDDFDTGDDDDGNNSKEASYDPDFDN